MLELAILGALMRESMHGYGLKNWLELNIGNFIAINFGALYPLLRRLEEQGLISSLQESGGRGLQRTRYSITPTGEAHWRGEMLAFPKESWVNAKIRFIVKLYFLSLLDAEGRCQVLEQRLTQSRQRLLRYSGNPEPEDYFQRQVAEYAVVQIGNEVGWLERLLARERALPAEAPVTTSER